MARSRRGGAVITAAVMRLSSSLAPLLCVLVVATASRLPASGKHCLAHCTEAEPLRLRGGASPRRKKGARLNDLYEAPAQNEFFAGGQDDQGGGSATVLLDPDEATNSTNATASPPPPPPRFTGRSRSLD